MFRKISEDFLFWQYWGLNSGLIPWATPPALFCDGFFQDRVLRTTFPLGWTLTCKPSSLGDWDQEGYSSSPAGAKNIMKLHLNRKRLVVTVCTGHSSKKHNLEGLLSMPAWAKMWDVVSKKPEQKGLEMWLKQ
jgi:hypothetical protein